MGWLATLTEASLLELRFFDEAVRSRFKRGL